MGDDQTMSSRGRTIIAVSAFFSFFAIASVVLRFFVKAKTGSRIFLDDYLIVAALIVTLGVTTNNIVGAAVAGIGENEIYRTDPEAPAFPLPQELLPQGQVMFALQVLHTCAMPLVKGSILAFYSRIFDSRNWFKAAVWVLSGYIFVWWLGILLATIFQCNPVSDNWGTQPSQLSHCLPNITFMYETAALTNMFSDVFILCLPIPIILHLHLLTKHKLAVLSILLTGSIVIVAGIGRTVAYFSYQHLTDDNYSADYYSLVIWTSLEPTLGVVGACLPCIRPAFRGWSPESILRSVRSVISLRSLRSSGSEGAEGGAGQKVSRGGGSRKVGGGSTDGGESMQGFTKMPEEGEGEDLEMGEMKAGMRSGRVAGTHSYAKSIEGQGGWTEGPIVEDGIMVQRTYDVVAGGRL